MKYSSPFRFAKAVVAGALLVASALPAVAKELPDGTVISKSNIDQIKDDTFMGHTIASLLTERQEWQVKNTNLVFKLGHAKEPVIDQRYWDATKKYSDRVRFDPKTREVTGYVAGMPFPDISPSDPFAGDKIVWNFYYGGAVGRDVRYNFNFLAVNRKGYEATQLWTFQRIYNKGRLGEARETVGDPEVFTKTLLAAVAPQDVKGVGTYTVRYDLPSRVEDSFAYIKSARRVRRLTGNAWMDPVGGFDLLQDDVNLWNSRPSWYKGFKVVGKRHILAVIDGKTVRDVSKAGTPGEFPQVDFEKNPGGWNYAGLTFTPREVWVVEGTPPDEHPYGKKVVYFDTKLPAAYLGEFYDKKGSFWRASNFYFQPQSGQTTGIKYYATFAGNWVDFKAMHATLFLTWGPTGGPVPDTGDTWSRYSVELLDRLQ